MKWNTEQLELGLNPHRTTHRSMQRLSQRRLQRASWWFEQMRRAVDNADAWTDLGQDRATVADEVTATRVRNETEAEQSKDLILGA